mmetsp:Transcript_13541/g.34747  ORF Transcript_13541/g.34747 Transcript_13541/m.34747 type:complete len:219 (-) Transcript_13541:202-858(-)
MDEAQADSVLPAAHKAARPIDGVQHPVGALHAAAGAAEVDERNHLLRRERLAHHARHQLRDPRQHARGALAPQVGGVLLRHHGDGRAGRGLLQHPRHHRLRAVVGHRHRRVVLLVLLLSVQQRQLHLLAQLAGELHRPAGQLQLRLEARGRRLRGGGHGGRGAAGGGGALVVAPWSAAGDKGSLWREAGASRRAGDAGGRAAAGERGGGGEASCARGC